MIKNLLQTAFHKVCKSSPSSATHKSHYFLRESGDFLSPFISLLLWAVVDSDVQVCPLLQCKIVNYYLGYSDHSN